MKKNTAQKTIQKKKSRDDKSVIKSRFRNKFSAVKKVLVSSISVDPKIFQGRSVPYAKSTVQKIVRKGFDTSQEPIYIYKKDGRNIVISGHSRFEAAKRVHLTSVPIKIFRGDFESAIDYAVIESNRSGKSEGIESDIKAYIRAKQRGFNKQFLRSIFKNDSYINTLQKLSYLSPKGMFIERLSNFDKRSFPYLERNAVWVGSLRKKYPKISNRQEAEIFAFLYKSEKGLKIKKQSFFDTISKKADLPTFNGVKKLQLNKIRDFDMIPLRDKSYIAFQRAKAKEATFHAEHERLLKLAVEQLKIGNKKDAEKNINKAKQVDEQIKIAHARVVDLRNQLVSENKRRASHGLF